MLHLSFLALIKKWNSRDRKMVITSVSVTSVSAKEE